MATDREETLKKAEKLIRQGKLSAAIEEYVRLVEDQPRDVNAMNALGDLYVRAGDTERAVAQFVRGADYLFGEGFFPKASALYKKALKIKPDHDHSLSQLADVAAQQGLLVDAKSHLKQLAERRRKRGDQAGVDQALKRLGSLEEEPAQPVASPTLTSVPESSPAEAEPVTDTPEILMARALDLAEAGEFEQALSCMDVVTDVALLEGNWEKAVKALQTFVEVTPYVPALVKLVELCVDAGLDEPMRQAQAQLADAYLEAGKGAEARFIAEDLLEYDPGSAAHLARRQRARALLGITDSPPEAAEDATPDVEETDTPIEIDLSDLLAGIPPARAAVVPDAPQTADPSSQVHDLDEAYARAQELLIGGNTTQAVSILERAARDPHFRYKASSDLGRLRIDEGDLQAGVEWLQRAAEAAPTPDEGFALLYELADTLERLGESARALAILMELDADAGEYRDVRSRIDALARAQTGSHGQ